MVLIIVYLLLSLILNVGLNLLSYYQFIDFHNDMLQLGFHTFLFGFLGGTIHCLRSVYIHYSVLKDWEKTWAVWYYLRPIVSSFMGLLSYIFIKAGLLVFTTQPENSKSILGFLAFAFLAGYNVQNFLKKIEDVSKVSLGIEPRNKYDG